MLSGVRSQIAIKIFGEDLDTLRGQAEVLRGKLASIRGITDLEIERRVLREVDAELVVAPDGDARTLAELASDCDAIMTNWAKVPAEVIDSAPRCRIVARLGIGLDNIDVTAATRRGMLVTNVPDYCLIEVAEHALALVLALARKVAFYHHQAKGGRYDLQAGPPLRRIAGQTLGIVGLGNIGRTLAAKALALKLRVLASDPARPQPPQGVTLCELDELLAESDYVSLHVPLVEANPAEGVTVNLAALARQAPLLTGTEDAAPAGGDRRVRPQHGQAPEQQRVLALLEQIQLGTLEDGTAIGLASISTVPITTVANPPGLVTRKTSPNTRSISARYSSYPPNPLAYFRVR